MIVTRFTDAIGEANLPVENYASNVNEISEYVHGVIGPEFEKYGIEVTKFLIENVSMPEEIKKEIFELSRLNTIDLDKLAKLKAAKALEKAAENESGTAGAGMGMGMGTGRVRGEGYPGDSLGERSYGSAMEGIPGRNDIVLSEADFPQMHGSGEGEGGSGFFHPLDGAGSLSSFRSDGDDMQVGVAGKMMMPSP